MYLSEDVRFAHEKRHARFRHHLLLILDVSVLPLLGRLLRLAALAARRLGQRHLLGVQLALLGGLRLTPRPPIRLVVRVVPRLLRLS
jgi:hypothetical protein